MNFFAPYANTSERGHAEAEHDIIREVRSETAQGPVLIAGTGRGFGTAAAHYFAAHASSVGLIARNIRRLDAVASEIRGGGNAAYAYACDLTHEREVIRTVREIVAAQGIPALCIYAVEDFTPGDILSTEVAAFEESWRANCLGAFIVGREIGRLMAERGSGTLVFMGGTSSLLARAGYLNLAVGKHALRALALVMARELGPKGIHVAHCIIDGEVSDTGADSLSMNPKHVAHEIMRLHLQPNDCWTSELDLRPAREKFWEHC